MGIELKGINKYYYYKKPNQNHALKDASLKIEDGELVAIVGKSGAGKSTLLHILGCIESYESGTYLFNGSDIKGLSDRKKSRIRNSEIGIVLQSLGLIEGYTVLENVITPLHFSGIRSKTQKTEMAMAALRRVNIEGLAECKVNRISGGQRQRVAIARAIVNSPTMLLADEPTGSLDSETAGEILDLFQGISSSGMTVIIVTHDEDVAKLCNRQITLCDGRIVSDSKIISDATTN